MEQKSKRIKKWKEDKLRENKEKNFKNKKNLKNGFFVLTVSHGVVRNIKIKAIKKKILEKMIETLKIKIQLI